MPQYPNARVNFGDVLQAIEDQLLHDGVVDTDAQITWGTPNDVPQFAGPLDLLLIARNGQPAPYDGGSAQFTVIRHVDIWIRSEAVTDPGGGLKQWITDTFAIADNVLDSVGDDDFWPEDGEGNLLTVESIKFAGDVPPARTDTAIAFGDYVGTITCKYMPKVNPSRGPHP